MPMYEYRCRSCGYSVSELRKIEERDRELPMCQHGEAGHPLTHPMERMQGTGGFVLKGGGWAAEGYAK